MAKKMCTCFQCNGYMALPESLICGHSFCKSCLESIIEERSAKEIILCPECRQACPMSKTREPLALTLILKTYLKKQGKLKGTFKVKDDQYVECAVLPPLTSRFTQKGSIAENPTQICPSDMTQLKMHFKQLKSLLTEGLDAGIQGCYMDRRRQKIVVDIYHDKEPEVREFLTKKFDSSAALNQMIFQKYEDETEYTVHKGMQYIEMGSQITDVPQKDTVDKYNNESSMEQKQKLLEGTACFTLGYFARDVRTNDKYLLTAMHVMSNTKGKHHGGCHLSAITESDKKAHRISDEYIGWIGGYSLTESDIFHKRNEGASELADRVDLLMLNESEDLVFLDIAAFKLKDEIPSGIIRFSATDENNDICDFIVPTNEDLNSDQFIDSIVQKWGATTGLTFGLIKDVNYCQSKYRENCGGMILIECINKRVPDFALQGDSGALVTDVMENRQFMEEAIEELKDSGTDKDRINAYGLISQTRSGKGISFATQLGYGLEMFKKEFDLHLELCSSE